MEDSVSSMLYSYSFNGQNVLYEYGSNHPTVRYTHPLTCDGGVCGPTSHFFVDAPISATVDGEKHYYLYDGLGSVTELIDEDENVVNQYRYTVFGESMYKEEEVFNPYQYTGRRYDEETGQYYYRARMYSPVQSRFISNDPMGMVDGPNMYAYVGNDPVNARDPSGCMSVPPNLINGGGGNGNDLDTCPGAGYFDFYTWVRRNKHDVAITGYDSVAQYFSDICYGQESTSTGGSSGSGSKLPELTDEQRCFLTELGISAQQSPEDYLVCAIAIVKFAPFLKVTLGLSLLPIAVACAVPILDAAVAYRKCW